MLRQTTERVLLIGDSQHQLQSAIALALPDAHITSVSTVFDGIGELSVNSYTTILAAAEPIERRPEPAVRMLRQLAGDGKLVLFGHPTLEILSRKMLQFGCDDYIITPPSGEELHQLFQPRALRLVEPDPIQVDVAMLNAESEAMPAEPQSLSDDEPVSVQYMVPDPVAEAETSSAPDASLEAPPPADVPITFADFKAAFEGFRTASPNFIPLDDVSLEPPAAAAPEPVSIFQDHLCADSLPTPAPDSISQDHLCADSLPTPAPDSISQDHSRDDSLATPEPDSISQDYSRDDSLATPEPDLTSQGDLPAESLPTLEPDLSSQDDVPVDAFATPPAESIAPDPVPPDPSTTPQPDALFEGVVSRNERPTPQPVPVWQDQATSSTHCEPSEAIPSPSTLDSLSAGDDSEAQNPPPLDVFTPPGATIATVAPSEPVAPLPAPPPQALAELPFADVFLDAMLQSPHEAPRAAIRMLNERLQPDVELRYTLRNEDPIEIPPGCHAFSQIVRAGHDEVGTLHLLTFSSENDSAVEGILAQLAHLIGKLAALRTRHNRLQKLSITDDLTGLYNARYFRHYLGRLVDRAQSERFNVTLLLFDIDEFKKYNDLYGHGAGDEILKQTAKLMRRCCREHDLVARIGGDEFAVVFWDKEGPRQPLDPSKAKTASRAPQTPVQMFERFKRLAASSDFAGLGESGRGRLSVSGGLAVYPYDARDVPSLIKAADDFLMFKAKKAGKNSVYLVEGSENGDSHD